MQTAPLKISGVDMQVELWFYSGYWPVREVVVEEAAAVDHRASGADPISGLETN